MLRYELVPRNASVGEVSPAVKEGTAIGVGLAIVGLGAAAAYTLYKNDQVPAAVVAGIGTIALGPRLASVLV